VVTDNKVSAACSNLGCKSDQGVERVEAQNIGSNGPLAVPGLVTPVTMSGDCQRPIYSEFYYFCPDLEGDLNTLMEAWLSFECIHMCVKTLGGCTLLCQYQQEEAAR
jgi:hypothetical protein